MSDALPELAPVSSDDLVTITQAVWSSFLDLDLTCVPLGSADVSGSVLNAVVIISGAWSGRVELACPLDHAATAAAHMFSLERGSAREEQVLDALGELANVVSGNVKSLLPAPSVLSLPSVSCTSGRATGGDGPAPGAALLRQVAFVAGPGPLHVSIWKGGTA